MSDTDETQEPITTTEATEVEESTLGSADLQFEHVLESQRWVLRATAPDGSVHILHNEEEIAAFNTQFGYPQGK